MQFSDLIYHLFILLFKAGLSYTLAPLEGANGFGAEIIGLNIKEVKVGQHDDLIKQIKDDLNKHSTLLIRNQVNL